MQQEQQQQQTVYQKGRMNGNGNSFEVAENMIQRWVMIFLADAGVEDKKVMMAMDENPPFYYCF